MSALDVSHLTKSYGDRIVVDDVSFHVASGEVFGMIGPNGAGKSTCMSMIVGLLKPDSGSISFDGKEYDLNNPELRTQLGLVPQELAIYPELTALQNLQFFGELNGLKGRYLRKRIDEVLHLTGLTANANHSPRTFSGGMQRRLNFGIALLHEPKFVVLDEPTVGIDPQSRSNLLDCVRDLGQRGVGVIYVTHYMEEIEAICQRIMIIDHGRKLREGTLDELIDRSQIDLCITVGQIPGELVSKLCHYGKVEDASGGAKRVCIRENLQDANGEHRGRIRTVLELLENAKVPLLGMTSEEMSLETLFLSLTGRKLRD